MRKNVLIDPVADNMDKRDAFATWLGQHTLAMAKGFYLEAVMIDYALLEERLLQMLWQMGFTDGSWTTKEKAVTLLPDRKDFLETAVKQYMKKEFGDNDKVSLEQITNKAKLVRCVSEWVINVEGGYQDDPFLRDLKHRCESLDIQYLLDTLEQIRQWSGYRNELTHTLFNKNAETVKALLKDHAEAGLKYARTLDSHIRTLKAQQ